MDEQTLRGIVREEVTAGVLAALASLAVEIVGVCPGHMASTTYWVAVRHGGRTLLKVKVADDGFSDGEQLGFGLCVTRSVKQVEEV